MGTREVEASPRLETGGIVRLHRTRNRDGMVSSSGVGPDTSALGVRRPHPAGRGEWGDHRELNSDLLSHIQPCNLYTMATYYFRPAAS